VHYDLGIAGLGLLVISALGFGLLMQLLGRAGTRIDWVLSGIGWFVGGLVASEMVAADAAPEDLVGGLALNAAIIGGGVVGVPVALALRLLADRRATRQGASA
jgi:hypothetical protein